jgi:hypothetical protein
MGPCSGRLAHRPAWLVDNREAHPKAFLSWLCRDGTEKKCSRYRETHEGAKALCDLDWASVLGHPERCTFVRALIEDLADGLGEPPIVGQRSPVTSRLQRRASLVLRNI